VLALILLDNCTRRSALLLVIQLLVPHWTNLVNHFYELQLPENRQETLASIGPIIRIVGYPKIGGTKRIQEGPGTNIHFHANSSNR
jgi:hypothetical protein